MDYNKNKSQCVLFFSHKMPKVLIRYGKNDETKNTVNSSNVGSAKTWALLFLPVKTNVKRKINFVGENDI